MTKLYFAVVLQALWVLQAYCSTDSPFSETVGFLESEEETAPFWSSNITKVVKNNLNGVKSSGENATTQFNPLSLVTRYAGTGYNIIRGNPEGDFNRGGVDPGIRTTNEIFTHTYKRGKRVYYRGMTMQVPDQVSFHMSQSCASSQTAKAYSGRKSYQKELETSLTVSGGYNAMFAQVSFSLSHAMARAETMTQKMKRIIIQKNKICNYGRARYLYENGVAKEPGYTLSRNFQNSVLHELPPRYDLKAYMRFIEKWGTHFIVTVDVGIRRIYRSSSSYKQVYKHLKKKTHLSTSVSGKYGPFSASVSFDMKKLNENINQHTKLGRRMKMFRIGSRNVPLPIHLELKSIIKALDKVWWGKKWAKYKINVKQRFLILSLWVYPRYVHAKKNGDPKISIKLRPQWPDGTYALPMAKWGCPKGWSSGSRYQDNQDSGNNNGKSRGIGWKMRVEVGRNIRFFYCVKTFYGNSGIRWPKGTYCIAKKGQCPTGFRPGSIHWDDEDSGNQNKRWGVLPDGGYGSNTEVHYCCRSDANHNVAMAPPTSRPFILYRYGRRCQRVRGMRLSQLWVHWDDEDSSNRDNCRGHHPDTPCKDNHTLHFCYYYRKREAK